MSRTVRLLLCSSAGEPLGALPPFEVPTPWWPDVEPVVEAARERFGANVVVLRIIETDADDPRAMGGSVTYVAEMIGDRPSALVPRSPADDTLVASDDPKRAPWARPGWTAGAIRWADDALDAIGRRRTGAAEQVKTWNLSSVLRLPTDDGFVWMKSTPTFMVPEGTILRLLGGETAGPIPRVLAEDPSSRTVLLSDLSGEDQWDAPPAVLTRMVRMWVGVQSRWTGRAESLVDAGLPDRRTAALVAAIAHLRRRRDVRDSLPAGELTEFDAVVDELPGRLDAIERCGLPATLVHGDFHPGNWRSSGDDLVLMDWGDCCVGHPLLDMAAFLDRVPPESIEGVRDAWTAAWLDRLPGADPITAAGLIGPVSALREALVYRTFLDGIERTEQRYHEQDVAAALRRAIALVR
jgi:Phosphotransferase enzyme family